MMGRAYRPALVTALLVLAARALAASPEAIRTEYAHLQRDLAHGDDGQPRDWKTPEAARLIEKAWCFVGARAVAHTAGHPQSSTQDLLAAINELNPPEAPAGDYDDEAEYLEKN